MSYEITSEEQPGCDTPKRATIHCSKKDLGKTIDSIAFEQKTAPAIVEDVLKGPLRRPDNPKYPFPDVSEDPAMVQRELEVDFPPKSPIKCLYSAKHVGDLEWTKPSLIFTHGSGGTLRSDAIANFTHGFVSLTTRPTLLCYQGNMNLKSRVKMFSAVIEARKSLFSQDVRISPTCLGGRSMGARAAVMASTEETTHLVLASYPLHTDKETRDQILLDIPSSTKVIFVSGDHDNMCDLSRLQEVRNKMKCKTWLIVVKNADHGMNVKPSTGTQKIGRMTGALVATWIDDANERMTESSISWDEEKAVPQWDGWKPIAKATTKAASAGTKSTAPPTKGAKSAQATTRKSKRSRKDQGPTEDAQSAKPRKRQKA